MSLLKKFAALGMAAVMCAAVTSCGKEESSSLNMVDDGGMPDDYQLTEDEMPYGATLTELRPESDEKLKIMVEYDNRFLEKEEVYLITDYLYALSQKDTETIKKIFHPALTEYILEYSGTESLDKYIEQSYENLSSSLGGDFEFTYADITEFDNVASDPDTFEAVDSRLAAGSEENILSKVTSRKCVTLGGVSMYKLSDGSEKLLENAVSSAFSIVIYQIDGQYYMV